MLSKTLIVKHFFYFLYKMKYLNIIRESIDKLIKEELSVSENLIKGVSSCTERIIKRFVDYYGNEGELNGNVITKFIDSINFGEYGSIDCYITIIDFPSKEEMVNGFKMYGFGGEVDQINYRINISIMSVHKGINKEFLYNTLFHESEHAYQFLRNNKELHSVESAYNKAVKVLENGNNEYFSDELVTIARLLYYFSKTEIEANINGLYGELVHNGCKLSETNFKVNFDLHIDLFKKFVETYNKNDFSEAFLYFNTTYNKLFRFVKKQEKYIIYRVRKVYQKAFNDSNNVINENKIIRPLGFYNKE